jgi:hypothetical protein
MVAASPAFISPLRFLEENPEAVLTALRQGWVDYWETAVDQVTDEHVRFALQSGLLAECADAFPDPRLQPEIPLRVLLTASLAAAFQGEYGLRPSGCALHSPVLLAELGLNAAWLAPGAGLSRRGTKDEAVFHGDVLRKLLRQVADSDRAAGRRPGESLLHWWNETVGPAMLRLADGGLGVWIRDVTKLLVNLHNPRYQGSEVATETKADGSKAPPQRGYKLGLLSCLLGTGRLLVQVAWDGLRRGDRPLTEPFVTPAQTPLTRGDQLLEDRGLLDGGEISRRKRDLGVDVVVPLKSDMLAHRMAVLFAARRPKNWQPHPRRERQQIQKVTGLQQWWAACTVPLVGCVVREWDAEKQRDEYWVFTHTNPERDARGIIRDYETRSECEEDHRQVKGPNWELAEYPSTALVEILYHVLMVLFAYNLCQLYAQTAAGQRFAGETKRARRRRVRREPVSVVVVSGAYYAVFPWPVLALELLAMEGAAKERLHAVAQRQVEGKAGWGQ